MSDVTALLEALSGRAEELADQITEQIRSEVPGYLAVPHAEHNRDVRVQIATIVNGLRSRRPPSAAAAERIREVGRRRAVQRLALPDLIEAYHIGYREIWNALMADAARHGPALTADLAREVSQVWMWFHRLTGAVADAYATETRTRATSRLAIGQRFVALLKSGGDATEEAALARALDFDHDGEFTVLCAAPLDDGADQLNDSRPGSGPVVAIHEGGRMILITQGPADHLVDAVHRLEPRGRVGIGLPRRGIAGAAGSLLDATQALDLALAAGRDVAFATDWFLVLLHAARDRLGEILAPAVAAAAEQPALADTVRAYADAGYSVSACARLLHVHPNTAAYRLERWRALTGLDVRDFASLATSLTCLNTLGPPDGHTLRGRAPAGRDGSGRPPRTPGPPAD